jgi:hypothetical protein
MGGGTLAERGKCSLSYNLTHNDTPRLDYERESRNWLKSWKHGRGNETALLGAMALAGRGIGRGGVKTTGMRFKL